MINIHSKGVVDIHRFQKQLYVNDLKKETVFV